MQILVIPHSEVHFSKYCYTVFIFWTYNFSKHINLLVHIYFFNLKFDILHTSTIFYISYCRKLWPAYEIYIFIYIFTFIDTLNNYIYFSLLIKIQIGTLVSLWEYLLYSQNRVLSLKQLRLVWKICLSDKTVTSTSLATYNV